MKYLVDVNMPKYFSYFNSPDFLFVADIDLKMSDTSAWNYASANNLIILTKDADFFSRCILAKEKVKVVHFQLGNMTLGEMHKYFVSNWAEIEDAINHNILLVCKKDKVEIVL